ncbi:MAG: nitroreductase [Microbacteriaceae bacterium]
MDATEFSAFLASRRSTRDFESTAVPQHLIDEILTDAMTAPSWSNTRPYMVAVATGAVRDRISNELLRRWEVARKALNGSWWDKILFVLRGDALPSSDYHVYRPYPKDLLPRSQKIGRELYTHLGIPRGDRDARDAQWARNFDLFGAPVAIFVFTHKGLPTYSASDAGLFMENLMLSAHARGLGTCAEGALAIWSTPVKKEFDVPKNYKLLCGIALGYPSKDSANGFQAERLPIAEITISEK